VPKRTPGLRNVNVYPLGPSIKVAMEEDVNVHNTNVYTNKRTGSCIMKALREMNQLVGSHISCNTNYRDRLETFEPQEVRGGENGCFEI
jgi:hypothetical protein